MEGTIKLMDSFGDVVSFKLFDKPETIRIWQKKWKQRYPKITDKNIIIEYSTPKPKYKKPKFDRKKVLGGDSGRKVPAKPHLDHVMQARFRQNYKP